MVHQFCQHFTIDASTINQEALRLELEALAKKYSTPLPSVSLSEIIPDSIKLYSDGACSGNPGKGGWGAVILLHDGSTIELSGAEAMTTNNRMELIAAIEALRYIVNQNIPYSAITLTTDSSYVKNGITQWIHNWKRNQWRTSTKEPVKNQDLWQALDLLNQQLKPQWLWSKGHAGHQWNERCDTLAVQARNAL
ncbi:ribonuclease HI [Spirochaetales bacterium BR151]|uniref:Ribonuclease H n=1 Tax=Entomospira culicis TaxID=2719989 RepID=A0A968GIR3_9SPIO|nr:ribonuclease HI [Entomospira culicis]NIZ69812.1 ribonuclease HI [Entomospira culicis]